VSTASGGRTPLQSQHRQSDEHEAPKTYHYLKEQHPNCLPRYLANCLDYGMFSLLQAGKDKAITDMYAQSLIRTTGPYPHTLLLYLSLISHGYL
jgi:hypothetical protein